MVLDRRVHSRQTIHPDVYVDLVPNNAGWLSNISEGGLALHLFFPAASGQAFRLAFDLPGTSSRIEANCQIAWTDDSGRKAGLRFLDLPETSYRRIAQWLSVPTPSLAGRLAGLFVSAVALCGLTFAFVYMLDLAESAPRPSAAPSADKPNVSVSDTPVPLTKPAASSAPLAPKRAVALQVAALTQEGNALAVAEALQKKNFPVYVLRPSTDRYYRVWVGPYADAESARLAIGRLEKEGFKAVIKH